MKEIALYTIDGLRSTHNRGENQRIRQKWLVQQRKNDKKRFSAERNKKLRFKKMDWDRGIFRLFRGSVYVNVGYTFAITVYVDRVGVVKESW